MAEEIQYAALDAGRAGLRLGWPQRSRTHPRDQWIVVRGRVRAPEGEWEFRDGSLMIGEVSDLVAWIRATSTQTGESSIEFLEPNLKFAAKPGRRDMIALQVRFIGEVAPPWIMGDSDAVWRTGYWLELLVTAAQLQSFAAGLERLIGN